MISLGKEKTSQILSLPKMNIIEPSSEVELRIDDKYLKLDEYSQKAISTMNIKKNQRNQRKGMQCESLNLMTRQIFSQQKDR